MKRAVWRSGRNHPLECPQDTIGSMYRWYRQEEILFRIIITVISNYCSVSCFGTGYNIFLDVHSCFPIYLKEKKKKKKRGFSMLYWEANLCIILCVGVWWNANVRNAREMCLMQSASCLKGDFKERSFHSLFTVITSEMQLLKSC